jgi:two-component system sensor histidine kinase TctE
MMRLARWSLRRNLLVWLFAPLLLLSVGLLWESYFEARHQADRAFDRTLLGSALAIADRVVLAPDGELEVDVPYVALEMLTSAAGDRVFYQVRGADGRLSTGYEDLPQPDSRPGPGAEPVFYHGTYKGSRIRAVAMPGAASNAQRSAGFMVVVAETTQGRQALARETMLRAGLRLAVLIVAAGIVLWFGVTRGLRPLERLGQAVGRRSPDDLRPVEHAVPREVEGLMQEINGLLGRLRDSLGALRRFTGNAGHQLRTPLSIVRNNLELARRAAADAERDDRIAEADHAVRDAERLVGQLMLLARVEESKAGKEGGETIDLNALAEDCARDRAAEALRAGLELAFEPAVESTYVQGNAVLFRELLLNLIDNAIRYAAPGHATIRVDGADGARTLEIEDDGPGIDAVGRERALTRFGQLDRHATEGAGLGLAISAEIAGRFGGSLSLEPARQGRGLCVRVRLPAD